MTATPLSLLLVEDNPGDARLIEEYLTDGTWREESTPVPDVTRAARLADGIDARSDEIDLVLLDLDLPDSTGLETLQSMVAVVDEEPIVVLTGLDDQRLGVAAVERGAQDYLVKDEVTPALLHRTIQYAIERERQQRELRRRNEELAVLNQVVRHDIRDDVTVILGWGDTLGEHVDPGGERALKRVLDAGEHITTLTETVGDVLKTIEGEREPDLHPSDLGRVLRTEVEKARATHDDVAVEFDDDLSADLTVDANELLSSVFRNLVADAIARDDGTESRVTVDVDVDVESIRVTVAGTGHGIPHDRREAVFGRGQRGLANAATVVELYLVDTLVDLFGGSVRIEDDGEAGSAFRVELPRS